MSDKTASILQKTDCDKLPSLPHVLLRLLEVCQQESISYDRLTTILRYDPALYVRVRAICHHIHCYGKENTDNDFLDTEKRLQSLGINTIKSIAVTATVQRFFSRNNQERTAFLKQHWHHSLYCALVAESIAKIIEYHQPEDAYISGLLHDIGQLVLETGYPDKYTSTFAELSEDDNFHNLEYDEFETTHQEVGAALLARQGINRFIQDAVRYHHEPAEQLQDTHPLVKIIYLANALTDSYFNPDDQAVFEEARLLLNLDKKLVLEILENAQLKLTSITKDLEISLDVDGLNGEESRQHEASDEYKQVQLAEQVRNIALLDGLHQHLSRSKNQQELLQTVTEHISILFSIDSCILFLYDAGKDTISAVSTDQQPSQLADISIPLVAGRSLVVDALLEKQAMHSFERSEKSLNIVDRQLIGFTGNAGMICLPMMMNNAAIGTLVMGIEEKQFEPIWKQMPLLTRFVNEVAHTLSTTRPAANRSAAKDSSEAGMLKQRIREVLHEVRNPLSIMNNYLGILGFKLEQDKPAQEDVQTIKAEIERISQILNRLTDTENTTTEASPVDINAVIADLTHVFQTSLFASKNIEISLDLDDRIETLHTNADAIKQIYTNLIKNAVEALPANGQVMVYTQDYVNVDGKEHIELCVADDGPGIDIDILPKLFSPVETTKGEGHAGLGLTIVKNLVSELNGSISCRSSDKGTSFHILLPKHLK